MSRWGTAASGANSAAAVGRVTLTVAGSRGILVTMVSICRIGFSEMRSMMCILLLALLGLAPYDTYAEQCTIYTPTDCWFKLPSGEAHITHDTCDNFHSNTPVCCGDVTQPFMSYLPSTRSAESKQKWRMSAKLVNVHTANKWKLLSPNPFKGLSLRHVCSDRSDKLLHC